MAFLTLGSIEVTEKAARVLEEAGQAATVLLDRHRRGEWDEEGPEGQAHNEFCAENGLLVAAEFKVSTGAGLWIVTSADRSRTRVQLPEEYMTYEVSIEEGYQAWAGTYDSAKNALIAVEEPLITDFFDGLSVRTALDLGCGSGRHLSRLSAVAQLVVGIDLTAAMLNKARRKAKRSASGTILLMQADLTRPLPIESRVFEFAFSSLVLSHIEDLRPLFQEVRRILRPGGGFLFSMFHSDALALGWRTSIQQADGLYRMPNYPHELDELQLMLSEAELEVHDHQEFAVADVPPGHLPPSVVQHHGDTPLCRVMSARLGA